MLDSATSVQSAGSETVEMEAASVGEYPPVDQKRVMRDVSNENGKRSECLLPRMMLFSAIEPLNEADLILPGPAKNIIFSW